MHAGSGFSLQAALALGQTYVCISDVDLWFTATGYKSKVIDVKECLDDEVKVQYL